MRSYSEKKVFGAWFLIRHTLAEMWVERVKDRDIEIRCHELARAVGLALAVERSGDPNIVVDGVFGAVDHSWLVLDPYGDGASAMILDVYTVGRLPMVQLVDPTVPGAGKHYQPRAKRTDINEALVRELAAEMLGR